MNDGPVAAPAEQGLSGPALDEACRAVLVLAPHPAIAAPAWWDANAPAHRVTSTPRTSEPLPPAPWAARRALDFCAELALALAPVHEAGAAHGALRPDAVAQRPDGGPLVQVPGGAGDAADDLHGVGLLLLRLLTGTDARSGIAVAGRTKAEADAAELLQSLLATDPAARPAAARAVAERLSAIAATIPATARAGRPPRAPRRRARLAAAFVLLAVAGCSGAYFATERVGPPGPTLSPATVSVPEPPAVTP